MCVFVSVCLIYTDQRLHPTPKYLPPCNCRSGRESYDWVEVSVYGMLLHAVYMLACVSVLYVHVYVFKSAELEILQGPPCRTMALFFHPTV